MRSILLAAAAISITACSGGEPTEATEPTEAAAAGPVMPADGGTAQTSMAAPPAAEYVAMAGASDLYEIQSSRAVLETTQNADLRQFAEMMIENHTGTTQAVAAAASEAGLTPAPPALDTAKAGMVRELEAVEGTARDAAYVRQQVMAHEQALALHQAYANGGDQPPLKAAAAAAVPIVERHLADIRRMQTAMQAG